MDISRSNSIIDKENLKIKKRKISEEQNIQKKGYDQASGKTHINIRTIPFRAFTRHHGEFSVMGTPSLQPFLKTYWLTPVQMTGQLSRSMQIRAREAV